MAHSSPAQPAQPISQSVTGHNRPLTGHGTVQSAVDHPWHTQHGSALLPSSPQLSSPPAGSGPTLSAQTHPHSPLDQRVPSHSGHQPPPAPVVRIFTDMSISPSLSPRQCPDRYAFRADSAIPKFIFDPKNKEEFFLYSFKHK
ncbi:hypothetical protein SOVF_197990 [Spinacia oleracea]|nr:hypothetical protein SOVF_197990 [Spinacia oleracea]